jgi:sensor domain CHASE-containing protein
MTTKTKSPPQYLSIAAASAVLLLVLIQWWIVTFYIKMENDLVKQNIIMCAKYIDVEVMHFDKLVLDWSSSEELYEFAINKNKNEEFAKKKLTYPILSGISVDAVVITGANGDILASCVIDEGRAVFGKVSDAMSKATGKIFAASMKSPTRGLYAIDKQVYLVASRPILKDDDMGDAKGIILMANLTKTALVNRIEQTFNVKVLIESVPQEEELYSDIVINHSKGKIIVAMPIKDAMGNLNIMLSISMIRNIYENGRAMSSLVFSAMVFFVFFCGLMSYLYVRKNLSDSSTRK